MYCFQNSELCRFGCHVIFFCIATEATRVGRMLVTLVSECPHSGCGLSGPAAVSLRCPPSGHTRFDLLSVSSSSCPATCWLWCCAVTCRVMCLVLDLCHVIRHFPTFCVSECVVCWNSEWSVWLMAAWVWPRVGGRVCVDTPCCTHSALEGTSQRKPRLSFKQAPLIYLFILRQLPDNSFLAITTATHLNSQRLPCPPGTASRCLVLRSFSGTLSDIMNNWLSTVLWEWGWPYRSTTCRFICLTFSQ